MKLKNVSLKLLSVVMTLAMLLAVCAPAVSALQHGDHDHDHEDGLNYVSLGDSMTNGYGLPGYNHNSGVADYGTGAYPDQFKDWLTDAGVKVNHAQLAMSGIRTEDIHWLLEFDYNDAGAIKMVDYAVKHLGSWLVEDEDIGKTPAQAWNDYFGCGDYWTVDEIVDHSRINATFAHIAGMTDYETYTECKDHKKLVEFPETVEYKGTNYKSYTMAEKIAVIAKYYQENVAAADIISLSVGNGNIGVFGFGRILETIGFQKTDTYLNYNYEDVLRECDPELKAEVVEMVEQIKANLAAYAPSEALANVALYIAVSLVVNYAGTLDAILQSNPDVEIILVPVMNTFGADNAEVEGITLGDLMGTVIDPINAFIAALPTVMQAAQNEVYADATFYWAKPGKVDCMVDEYELPFAPDGIFRNRFVESIVGYCDCGNNCSDVTACKDYSTGMIWGMVAPMFNKMLGDILAAEVPGVSVSVVNIDVEDIEAYENGTLADASKALSCAIYLAFEEAIVTGKDAPVTLDSIFGLSDLGDVFGGVKTAIVGGLDFEAIMATVTAKVMADGEAEIGTWAATPAGQEAISNYTSVLVGVGISDPTVIAQISFAIANEHVAPDVLMTDPNAPITVKTALTAYFTGKYAPAHISVVLGEAINPVLSGALVADDSLEGLLALFARCVIGNGLGAHPSQAGHDELAKAVIEAYKNEWTAQKETIETLLYVITEYYDDAYAYGYQYAVDNGYIATATDAIDTAIEAIKAIEFPKDAMTPKLEAKLKAELAEVVATLEELKAVLEENDAATVDGLVDTVLALEDDLYAHLDNVAVIMAQAGVDVNTLVIIPAIEALNAQAEKQIAILNAQAEKQLAILNEQLMTAVGEAREAILAEIARVEAELEAAVAAVKAQTEKQIETLKAQIEKQLAALKADIVALNNAVKTAVDNTVTTLNTIVVNTNEYFKENLPVAYKQLVDMILAQLPAADQYLYDWFYNNPDVVIGFFTEYGDDMLSFLVDNADIIVPIVAFIIYNYGEDVLNYVIDNADQILPAFVSWFDAYGERTWELVKVYLDALGVNTDILSPEGLLNALNNLFALIADLGEEFAQQAWDKLVASGIFDEIMLTLDNVKAQAWEQLVYLEGTVRAEFLEQLAVLEAELASLKAQLEAAIEAGNQALVEQLEAAIAQVEAAIAKIKAELAKIDALILEIKATIETIIEQVEKVEAAVRKIIALIESNIDVDALLPLLQNALEDLSDALIDLIVSAGLLDKLETALNILVEQGVDALVAYLKALGNELVSDAADALEAVLKSTADTLSAAIQAQIVALADKISTVIDECIKAALTGEYIVVKDSFYVAVGSDPAFAELLAQAIVGIGEKYNTVGWDNVSVEDLIKADLITLSYNENELSNFAINQALGYMADFVNVDLKPSVFAYVVAVMTEVLPQLLPSAGEEFGVEVGEMVNTMLEETIDGFCAEYFGDATTQEMDWATIVGAENVTYVDQARAEIKNKFLSAGVPETFAYRINVLDYLYANLDMLGDYAKLFANKEFVYAAFGEKAFYTIEIPVADTLVFAGESYLYGYTQFNKKYAETVLTINKVNPDATVVVLGHYNAFQGIVLDLNGTTVDLGEMYGYVADLTSAHPFAYAILMDNVTYVDISDAETVFGALAADANVSLIDFVLAYLADTTITNVSADGHEYIKNQILNAITVTCGHDWIDATCTTVKTCSICGETEGDVLGHSFTDYVSDGNATCTEDGTKTAKCDNCDETNTIADVGSALKHSFTNYVSDGNATCTEDGTKTAKCDNCDETDTIPDENSKTGHYHVLHSATSGTCKLPGQKIYKCVYCNDTYSVTGSLGSHMADPFATCTEDQTCRYCGIFLAPAKGHTEVVDEAKAPTCTETGLTEGSHCSVCGEVIVAQETVDALGHTEVVDEAKAPTCTETGLTEGLHCSVCDEVIVAQETVDALGHTEVVDEAKAPTCTETGLTEGSHCSVCGETIVAQEIIKTLPHTEVVDEAKAPTCTETGLTEGKHCSVCGEIIVAQQVVDALGHTEVIDKAVAATCTEAGKTEGKHCSACNMVFVAQQTIAAKGHTEVVDKAVDATCTTAGKTEGKHCSVCNTVLVAQQTIAARGHVEVIDYAVEATCTEAGKTEGKHCFVCNTVLVAQQTIAAKGHTEVVDKAVAATCTADGKTEGKHCSVCSTVIVAQQNVAAKGHTEVVDKAVAATCTAAGKTEGKHCSVCNAVLVAQYELSAKGHIEVIDRAVAATCTAAGKTEGKHCSVCNTVLVAQTEVAALGHKWAAATCTAPKTCETCGLTEGEVLAHTYGEWEIVKEATEQMEGERKQTCTACGHSVTEAIDKLIGGDDNIDDDKKGGSVGIIVGISAGSVAVLGGGAFLLLWFFKKKKIF